MTERHKHADVLIAYAEGKCIQGETQTGQWCDFATFFNPITNPDIQWRIKPETVTVWVNVYPDGFGQPHETKEDANKRVDSHRIACVQLTYTPGEGL